MTKTADISEFEFVDPQTGKRHNPFKDAGYIRAKYGEGFHADLIQRILDRYEPFLKAGAVYDIRRKTQLHDRSSLLEALYRDHKVGIEPRGKIRG